MHCTFPLTYASPNRLNQSEQQELQKRLEKNQMKDFANVRIQGAPATYLVAGNAGTHPASKEADLSTRCTLR